jgi:hypothetical protein
MVAEEEEDSNLSFVLLRCRVDFVQVEILSVGLMMCSAD